MNPMIIIDLTTGITDEKLAALAKAKPDDKILMTGAQVLEFEAFKASRAQPDSKQGGAL